MAHRNHNKRHQNTSNTESLAMCKTGDEHAANMETHFTQNVKTQDTCHTKHESMQQWKHKLHATQNKRKQNKCTRTEQRTASKQDQTWTPTQAWNKTSAGIRTPWNRARRQETERLKTMNKLDRSDRTLTIPCVFYSHAHKLVNNAALRECKLTGILYIWHEDMTPAESTWSF